MSQCNLGLRFERGNGVAKDVALAAELFAKSAAQGYARAQRRLAICYREGRGVAQDAKLAAAWDAKASAQSRA